MDLMRLQRDASAPRRGAGALQDEAVGDYTQAIFTVAELHGPALDFLGVRP